MRATEYTTQVFVSSRPEPAGECGYCHKRVSELYPTREVQFTKLFGHTTGAETKKHSKACKPCTDGLA